MSLGKRKLAPFTKKSVRETNAAEAKREGNANFQTSAFLL